jgi:regulator of telomere elongation helicase 1
MCSHTHTYTYNAKIYYLQTQVSEGLDFSDRAGRGVIITGIPYAMRNDPKVNFIMFD